MASWSAIVGARSDDKGAALHHVLDWLRESGVRLGGFYQERVLDDAGEVAGWDVVRLGQPGRASLARRSDEPDMCDYAFKRSGFAAAAAWVDEPGADLIVVGGMGKLEAAGGGHWPVVEGLLAGSAHTLLCIRDTSLSGVALRLPDPVAYVHLPCDPAELDAFSLRLTQLSQG